MSKKNKIFKKIATNLLKNYIYFSLFNNTAFNEYFSNNIIIFKRWKLFSSELGKNKIHTFQIKYPTQ